MSADAASLPCPVCSHTSVFNSAQSLRDRLIHVSTNKISCPVCQEEISGLDKLTIHLFSHVQLLTSKQEKTNNEMDVKEKLKRENGTTIPQKKPRSAAKNKTSSSALTTPVKFVKIYPKLPVISLNPVPIIDMSQRPMDDGTIASEPIQFVKTETALLQTNTTCNICSLQFVDNNILRMHRCLIHNIDETTYQAFTRYNCHLCPKNFKMRGSLMVHLRVAHYGFLSGNSNLNDNSQNPSDEKYSEESQDKSTNYDRNDNKQWQCDVCKKCFTTKYFLKKHKRLHTGETPYACTQCNKTFTFQQSYHKHLLYHNDEKPHTCTFCGRAFKELSTLHNHQRIHTGEKPFACETCGKCFRQRVSYLVHRRIHTGVMPYKCTACEKNFRYKVSQRTHKCQAQPPGTVVRQTGDLVEKLKKKQPEPDNHCKEQTNNQLNTDFIEVSEASAELVRTGAKISLEDMESENFSIISEFTDLLPLSEQTSNSKISHEDLCFKNVNEMFHTDIDLIDTIPIEDKNVPSPSEILKKLSLSKEEEYAIIQEKKVDMFNEFNIYL